MVNIDGFTTRLKKVMEHHHLTASLFADKIDVQRSSISHIISGRNKPSLDFILKVTNTFTDVDIYWLLNGKGSFPKQIEKKQTSNTSTLSLNNEEKNSHSLEKKIQRIVVFYADGTFEEYKK
ncbi:MAG: helix-turn-helix transcriptional regulator [Polaribacter sp.]|nr:helix-turn-helix transcriptional regulator [Polaribacter sp.]MDG1811985.1 helix-turn-helix transcriptional regulator [Polaribacter sp.]MDG1994346.1 helix-turn-helix transcriptional regulator [Polaribacter sp.]